MTWRRAISLWLAGLALGAVWWRPWAEPASQTRPGAAAGQRIALVELEPGFAIPVLRRFCEIAGLRLSLDYEAEQELLKSEELVRPLRLRNVTPEAATRAILTALDYPRPFVIHDGQLRPATTILDIDSRQWVSRVYDVGPTLRAAQGFIEQANEASRRAAADPACAKEVSLSFDTRPDLPLSEHLAYVFSRQSGWPDYQIELIGNRIVAVGPHFGQKRIECLAHLLNDTFAGAMASASTTRPRAPFSRAQHARQHIDFHGEGVKLTDALEQVGRLAGLNVVVTWPSLHVTPDRPVTVRLTNAEPLTVVNAILASAAGEPHGLCGNIDDNILIVTRANNDAQYTQTRCYDVRKLILHDMTIGVVPARWALDHPGRKDGPRVRMATDKEAGEGYASFLGELAPNSWLQTAGKFEITYFAGLLIVNAPPRVHEQVDRILFSEQEER